MTSDAADSSDHEGAARAIAAGLVEGHSKEKPGFWLHTGGTGILTYEDSDDGRLGEHSDKEYNDLDGIDELTGLPDHAFHRNIDKIVLETTTKHNDSVKATIVCPPTIYGQPLPSFLLLQFPRQWLTLPQATDADPSPAAAARSTRWAN